MTDANATRAGGALPLKHPLYAPGLKRRARQGWELRVWLPTAKDVTAGFLPKQQAFPPEMPEADVAAQCRDLWALVIEWRVKHHAKPKRYTFAWLIERYLTDEESPFHKLQPETKANYRNDCRTIVTDIGKVTIDSRYVGEPINGARVRQWWKKWGAPAALDGSPRPSRARHLISMVRTLVTYAVELLVPGAAALREMLAAMKFPAPPQRTKTATHAQVYAIAEQAVKDGWPSIATATLAQFELIERRTHVIGKWDGAEWGHGWVWSGIEPGGQVVGIGPDWTITYYQTKRGRVLREFDLKNIPQLHALLAAVPEDRRAGAVVKCESTGEPWRKRYYCEIFRDVARRAGAGDTLWSADMRSGGASEADIAGVTDRQLQDAGGWLDPKMVGRYRRDKQRNAQAVVLLRQKAREREGGNG